MHVMSQSTYDVSALDTETYCIEEIESVGVMHSGPHYKRVK